MTENDDETVESDSGTERAETTSTGDRRETLDRVVTVVLLALLAISLVAVIYLAVNPIQTTDPYTEFYLLGPDGNASNYPTQLEPGEEGTVIVGITNHEAEEVTYHLRVVARNRTLATRSPSLANEETWEEEVSFRLEESGQYRVRFLLYKTPPSDPPGEPYLTTRLLVTVGAETDTPAAVVERRTADVASMQPKPDVTRVRGPHT